MEPDGYPSEPKVTSPSRHRRLRIPAASPCEDATDPRAVCPAEPADAVPAILLADACVPDSVLRLLSCIDYRTGVALVAEDADAARATVVAAGSVTAISDESAELASSCRTTAGQGVGTVLIAKLLEAAEDAIFHRFVVHMRRECGHA